MGRWIAARLDGSRTCHSSASALAALSRASHLQVVSNWDNLPAIDRATGDEPAYHTRCDRCGAEICMRGDACNLGDTSRGPGVADSVDPDVRLCATGACAAADVAALAARATAGNSAKENRRRAKPAEPAPCETCATPPK